MAEHDMFAAVNALLAQSAGSDLPPPAERARLRRAAGVTQEQVAAALGLKRRETVAAYEADPDRGGYDPVPPRRTAYAKLLEGWAELYPAPDGAPSGAPSGARPASASAASAAPARRPAKRRSAAQGPRRPARKTTPASAAEGRFADGPLVVVDGEGAAYGNAYGVGGQVWECPATDVVSLVEWVLGETALGGARLHRHGTDADPLVVLTASGAQRLGLPDRVPDVPSADGGPRLPRLPDDHPVLRALEKAGWRLTRRGFGPWARIYRPVEGGRRRCVQLAVLPWGALEERAWGPAAGLSAPELARTLGAYAARVLTPRGSTAVCGLELMTALRPPTQAVWSQEEQRYVSGPVAGSLTRAVDPAPPEAPRTHPLAAGRPDGPGHAVDEEAYDWARDPQTLTDEECALPWAVGLDVNAAFLAASNRLTVGLGEPEHVARPRFDKRTPGCWLVDLSGVEIDPRLPSPFTPDGTRPAGPAWYETPTVAYAAELGAQVEPLEAWIYRESGGYLDPWYQRLSAAYLTTMERLGVPRGMDPAAYLAAMERHKETDPAEAAVLSAIKATVKGGVGKLAEGPRGRGWRPGQPWPALERPTWRPHIRYTLISTARMWMHRRMRRMAECGLFPLGVLSDCVVYPSAGPSPLDLLPRAADGTPAKGVFPLGPAPGQVKHEGSRPFLWAAEMLDLGDNPARYIKGGDAVAEGE